MSFSIMVLTILTPCVMTLGIVKLNFVTLGVTELRMTLEIAAGSTLFYVMLNDAIILTVFMLSVITG